jgi:hypothetical protein
MKHLILRRLYVLTGLMVSAALVQFFAYDEPVERPYLKEGEIVYEAAVAHWKERLVRVGAPQAHDELLDEGNRIPLLEAHFLAHSFGQALFEENPDESLVCGKEFLWGCYHQFVGGMLSENGVAIVKDLFEQCKAIRGERVFSCEHGMGHGILGYFGYELSNLNEALAVCETIEPSNPRNGCFDGVFMEYNLRELVSLETAEAKRPWTHATRLTPCFDVDIRHREACVYELPIWWATAGISIQIAGEECRIFADTPTLLKACFEGIGHNALGNKERLVEDSCSMASDVPAEIGYCVGWAESTRKSEAMP